MSKRCAIYTRKSSEEGLEQEFNSLHAQREACEAFIKSQKHEGWQLIKTAYDDGGISGGTMQRPALKQLLDDIENHRVDVIVVYKVDRLTRSLADFAKMVELFDKHQVSFVSVTQQFNTTTSMGRLTLNVLLSFAQFEREVTGERIRDKIAASKAKGMWMGGSVPLGYDAIERKLVVNEKDAPTAKYIFKKYLELGCVRLLKEHLDQNGIKNKTRIKDDGTIIEGKSFSRGCLYNILANPIYIGKVRHKKLTHQGLHDEIIENNLWEQVQQKLKTNAVESKSALNRKTESSLLIGKLFDESGKKLTPSHANKQGKRYRYYISNQLNTETREQNKTGWRLPAHEIENIVIQATKNILDDDSTIASNLQEAEVKADHMLQILAAAKAISHQIPANTNELFDKIIQRVDLKQNSIRIVLLLESIKIASDIPLQIKRRGIEMRLVLASSNSKPDPTLVKALAKAHKWFAELASGKTETIAEIAKREKIDNRYVSHIINLAFLSPNIIEEIIVGSQPVDISVQKLIKTIDMPINWQEQKQELGFA